MSKLELGQMDGTWLYHFTVQFTFLHSQCYEYQHPFDVLIEVVSTLDTMCERRCTQLGHTGSGTSKSVEVFAEMEYVLSKLTSGVEGHSVYCYWLDFWNFQLRQSILWRSSTWTSSYWTAKMLGSQDTYYKCHQNIEEWYDRIGWNHTWEWETTVTQARFATTCAL